MLAHAAEKLRPLRRKGLPSREGGCATDESGDAHPQPPRNVRRTSAVYAVEMSDEQHERLAGVLRDVRGMVMLSTYRSEMYDRLYTGWTCIERETHADGARYRVEQLWLNPACATAQRQQRLIA